MGQLVKRLLVCDVAERTGLSLRAARALMVRLERKHGTTVVRRDGKRMYTDERAFEAAWKGGCPEGTVERKLDALSAKVRAHDRRFRAMAHAFAVLRNSGKFPELEFEQIDEE